MRRYEIPDSAIRYILFQRTSYLRFTKSTLYKVIRKRIPFFNYNLMVGIEAKLSPKKIAAMYLSDMEREYRSMKGFLPDNCSRILDIGCGIAGIDIFLNEHYSNRSVDFYLLDKNEIEERVYYMYEEKGAFYNSLDLAKSTLVINGVEENHVHLIEAADNNDINMDKSVDFVLSLISWGFHYPVGVYLDKVYDLLVEEGVLILDIRKNTDGLDLLNQKFGNHKVVNETSKFCRVCVIK